MNRRKDNSSKHPLNLSQTKPSPKYLDPYAPALASATEHMSTITAIPPITLRVRLRLAASCGDRQQ